ncbi:MAG: hypothetical protein NTZ19_05205 [Bacteroidetes bacterium]|nr:hypothetical protein [Bacteroidota bacterium]
MKFQWIMKLKTNYFFTTLIALLTFATVSELKAQPNTYDTSIGITKSTDEGLSVINAVIISETTELKGLNAEYKWIKEHFVNYKLKMQTLNIVNDKPYDIITILQADGKELKIYFNIESFYGKF